MGRGGRGVGASFKQVCSHARGVACAAQVFRNMAGLHRVHATLVRRLCEAVRAQWPDPSQIAAAFDAALVCNTRPAFPSSSPPLPQISCSPINC